MRHAFHEYKAGYSLQSVENSRLLLSEFERHHIGDSNWPVATWKPDLFWSTFNLSLPSQPNSIPWREAYRLTNEDGSLRDLFHVCSGEELKKEGFRLLWCHFQGKAESDTATGSRRLEKAIQDCTDLRERLLSARTGSGTGRNRPFSETEPVSPDLRR